MSSLKHFLLDRVAHVINIIVTEAADFFFLVFLPYTFLF